jgi:hypothetical protein
MLPLLEAHGNSELWSLTQNWDPLPPQMLRALHEVEVTMTEDESAGSDPTAREPPTRHLSVHPTGSGNRPAVRRRVLLEESQAFERWEPTHVGPTDFNRVPNLHHVPFQAEHAGHEPCRLIRNLVQKGREDSTVGG